MSSVYAAAQLPAIDPAKIAADAEVGKNQPAPTPEKKIDPAVPPVPEDGATPELVLNGAQVAAALEIVLSVTEGLLPRDSGIAMLKTLFNLTAEQAEEIMGSAGTATPTTPNPSPQKEQEQQQANNNPPPPPPAKTADVEQPQQAQAAAMRWTTPFRRALPRGLRRKVVTSFVKVERKVENAADRAVRDVLTAQRAAVVSELVKQATGHTLRALMTGSWERASKAPVKLTGGQIDEIVAAVGKNTMVDAITPTLRRAYESGAASLEDLLLDMGVEEESLLDFQARRLPELVDGYVDRRLGTGYPTAVDDATRMLVNEAVLDATREGMNLRDTIAGIRDVFDASLSRSRTIARTESSTGMNGARYELMQTQQVEWHMWMTAGDENVRDAHAELDGMVVMLGAEFLPGLRFPGDPSADADLVINCRCCTAPVSRSMMEALDAAEG
jgi:SPP1 gp7 family putative phage head morphogenesis protein